MKIWHLMIGSLVLILASTSYGQPTPPLKPSNSSGSLTLAGKNWKLRFKDENSNMKIMEYITNNETINKWGQLITIQKFNYRFPKEVSPLAFGNKEAETLKAQGLKATFSVLESTPQEAIVEFRVSSPPNQQQDELQRIIRTPSDQLIVLHYAIRQSDMGQEERTKWIQALKQLNLPDL